MRVFRRGAGGAIGARPVPRLIEHGYQVTGTSGRVRALGAEPVTLGQPPARAWRPDASGS